MRVKLLVIIFIITYAINGLMAQAPCQTYSCYLCIWSPPMKIVVPNIFSPNGDNVNDYWVPQINDATCLGDYNLIVFNREGQLIFETDVYDVPWNGKNAADGAYFFILNYTNFNTRKAFEEKGIVYVTR